MQISWISRSGRRDNFCLPFPARGWTSANSYVCQAAEGVWVQIVFYSGYDDASVLMSFWSGRAGAATFAGAGPLRPPAWVENDVILITALIHDFVKRNYPGGKCYVIED